MKLKIVGDDGSIRGWFIAACETAIVFAAIGCGFFIQVVKEGWVAFGSTVTTIFLGSFGIWLTFKGVTEIFGKKIEGSGTDTTPVDPQMIDLEAKIREFVETISKKFSGGLK